MNTESNELQRLIITDRDISTIEFVFQMRFATSTQIMNACFGQRRDGNLRTSDLYVKRRLAKLVQAKFLRTGLPPTGGNQKYFYQITRSSLAILQGKGVRTCVCRVPQFRNQDFDHDSHVIDCRIALEKASRATNWVPEFQIRSLYNAFENLPAKYIPDGLFTNRLGELTAFEMEISRKSLDRYEDKIQKYVSLVRSYFNEDFKFKRVLFVAKHKDVYKILSEKTKIHSDIFKVESYEQLMVAK